MAQFYKVGETKIRPGVYQRHTSNSTVTGTGARDGVCAITVRSDWGPLDTVTSHYNAQSIQRTYGAGAYSADCTVQAATAMIEGGAQQVYVKRLGTGGKQASYKIKDTDNTDLLTVIAKYPGEKKIRISIQEKLGDSTKKILTVYDDVSEVETWTFAADGTKEPENLKAASERSEYIEIKVDKAESAVPAVALAEGILTGGENPKVTNESYSKAWEALEPYFYNVIALDFKDDMSMTLSLLLQAYLSTARQESGKQVLGVVGEPVSVEFKDRCEHAKGFNDKYICYLGNGYKNTAGDAIDGVLAICQAAGDIASTPSNQSIVHKQVKGAVDLIETLTNAQYSEAIKSGMLLLSKSANGQIWYDSGINTLITPAENEDEGWKKIRRVKTRIEAMDRIDRALDTKAGRVNGDSDGIADIIQTAQGVLNDMVRENKLYGGASFTLNTDNVPTSDSAWFVITADDVDSLEKIYLDYHFRYQNV